MVATLAPKDGEFLRKISHQLIWWLHRKLSNRWLETGGFEFLFKSGSGSVEIRKSGVLLGE
jgi:hypothetical protein